MQVDFTKIGVSNRMVLAILLLLLAGIVLCVYLEQRAFESSLDANLYAIVHPKGNAVSASSDAYAYIQADKMDYDSIVQGGTRSLSYMLKKFAANSDDGLEQYIMAVACSEILGTATNRDTQRNWISGRDWYNQYTKNKTPGS